MREGARRSASNPYVGLRPFFERDSLYFFGRGQQTAELLEILHQQRFLGVVGSSGSGKSSLVRAGLLPKLLGGFLAQDRDRWRIVRMKPGRCAARQSRRRAARGRWTSRQPPDERARARAAHPRRAHRRGRSSSCTPRLERNANVFVLVDQFEEIFAFRGAQETTARRRAPIRRAGRNGPGARPKPPTSSTCCWSSAQRRELPIYVALTMRTDFLGECDLFYGLPEALNRGRYLVPRLTRQQLREADRGPGAAARRADRAAPARPPAQRTRRSLRPAPGPAARPAPDLGRVAAIGRRRPDRLPALRDRRPARAGARPRCRSRAARPRCRHRRGDLQAAHRYRRQRSGACAARRVSAS